jgi:uncharacterized Tic20 family protein
MKEISENPKPMENPKSETNAEQSATAKQPENAQQSQTIEEISKDARQWAMFCHLAGLAGYIMPLLGNIVVPLVLWQVKKDEYPFVDEQGKEAVNFQISMSLYAIAGITLCLITCIGAVLIPVVGAAVGIVDLVFLLIAAIKANNAQSYHYPLTIRFIK